MQSQQADISTIRLSEYQPQPLHLTAPDRNYLLERFAGRLRVSQQVFEGETWDVIDPGPHVGVLTLPSGRRLECRPKVDAGNIFYMMAVAHELPRLEEETAEFDSFDALLEFVVDRFATLAEERLREGLFRRYVEREDNLGVIRGRILIAQDLRQNIAMRHRTFCEYSELTWDIPENQVIRQVAYQMSGWPFRRELRSRLSRIDVVMEEVSPSRFSASVVDSFVYSRLNYEYQAVHHLCRLLLDVSSFHEDVGFFEFQTFLVNMNELFESYVARSLEASLPVEFGLQAQAGNHLDRRHFVQIIPDVVLKRGGVTASVLDTKYKRLDQGEFKNHDLYQVLSYCTALEVGKGMLIYPKHLLGIEQDVEVMNSGIVIRQMTLDLGGNAADLEASTQQLVRDIATWSS